MKLPEGSQLTMLIFKQKKSLYGLKQVLPCWNSSIAVKCNHILEIEIKPRTAASCIFIRKRGKNKIISVLYVDDGLFASTSEKESKRFLEELKLRFKITSKLANYFLGMKIEKKSNGCIWLYQKPNTKRIFERLGMENCKKL